MCARESHGSWHLFAVARTLPSPTMFAFCSLDVKLLFVRSDCTCGPTCLTHRAKTALRPSSLLCSSVSLANRTFPPLRPPNLYVSKRHDVWILASGHFNHPPDTHLLKIRDLLGSFRNSPPNRLRVACGLLQMQEQPRTEDNAASCRHWSCQIALGRVLGLQGVGAESTIPVLPAATSTAEGAAKFSPSADRTLSGSDFAGDESSNPVSA